MEKGDKIKLILKKNSHGLTITDLVDKSGFSRPTVRTILAKLEGAQKISFRKIGMAKVYTFRGTRTCKAGTLAGSLKGEKE